MRKAVSISDGFAVRDINKARTGEATNGHLVQVADLRTLMKDARGGPIR